VARIPCNVRRFQERVFTLWRCTGCGSLHCAEDADLALYYADYPLKRQNLGFAERIGYGNRLRLLERQGFRRSDRVLDYGCGAGLFVRSLRQKGLSQVFGYDAFVPEYQDPRRLEESYDAVVSYDVIEHDDDPREFMRLAAPLVRSRGLFVIGTPNADHVSLGRKGDPSLHPPYHRHILSERILLALGREQGLEPEHIHRRSYFDSLFPTVNSRFMWRYLGKSGLLDTAVEPPQTGLVLRSPDLLFFAFFGYFLPAGDSMIVSFRKK
jgi:SAM-dependent methyltransferase